MFYCQVVVCLLRTTETPWHFCDSMGGGSRASCEKEKWRPSQRVSGSPSICLLVLNLEKERAAFFWAHCSLQTCDLSHQVFGYVSVFSRDYIASMLWREGGREGGGRECSF
ncbi:hypothetical protein BHM03_00036355 [Ensete ventricosum]|nr:hypothetical protein BHM03_00036355 [Ensete ventricosum]